MPKAKTVTEKAVLAACNEVMEIVRDDGGKFTYAAVRAICGGSNRDIISHHQAFFGSSGKRGLFSGKRKSYCASFFLFRRKGAYTRARGSYARYSLGKSLVQFIERQSYHGKISSTGFQPAECPCTSGSTSPLA